MLIVSTSSNNVRIFISHLLCWRLCKCLFVDGFSGSDITNV